MGVQGVDNVDMLFIFKYLQKSFDGSIQLTLKEGDVPEKLISKE